MGDLLQWFERLSNTRKKLKRVRCRTLRRFIIYGEFMSLSSDRPRETLTIRADGTRRFGVALVRGLGIPQRDDALDWVKEQEDRRECPQRLLLGAAIAAARAGALLLTLRLL